jgi:hypothetical protein
VKPGKAAVTLKPADTLALQAGYAAISAPTGAAKTTEIKIRTSSPVNPEIILPVTVLPPAGKTGF